MVLIVLIILGAFLDVSGLAAFLPVLSVAVDPGLIESNAWLNKVYNGFGFTSTEAFLVTAIMSLFLIFIIKNLFSIYIHFVQSNYSSDISTSLSEKQFRQYFQMNYQFIKQQPSNLLLTNIVSIPQTFSIGILMPVIIFFSESVVILLIVVGIALFDLKLLLVLSLILLPTFLVLYRWNKNKMYRIGQERKEIVPKAYTQVSQPVLGFLDVKLFQKEGFFLRRFLKYQSRINKLSVKNYILHFIPGKVIEVVAMLGLVIIFVYTLYFSANREELLLFISLFAAAAYRVMPSMNKILNAFMTIKASQYALDILTEIPDKNFRELVDYNEQMQPMDFKEGITLEHVNFRFNDGSKDVLEDVSINIQKGETVGFYGPSGSGKSTLINLILGFYLPTGGKILIDGKQLTERNLLSWRANLGYVKQDPYILDLSLKENIAFGEEPENIDMDRLQQAIKSASLIEVVDELPDGVETRLEERGARFSGGQKQRIEIARALYRNAQVLVLDEATSALDTQTENEIIESITYLREQQKTILVIAHNLSTLKGCKRIFELRQGKITKSYSYEEMVEHEKQSE